MKILIVEDERLVAEDIAECLEMYGYDICGIANNGQKALALAEEHRPNLVLEDIVVQGDMDGIEIALEMRKRWDIPSIFLTAYSQEGILERAKEASPLGYIIKPFEENSLISTVKMALHKSFVDEQFKESAEWFSTTLNSIGDGVIATDSSGNICYMNALSSTLTGWSLDQAEGKPIDEVFVLHKEDSSSPIINPVNLALRDDEVKFLEEGCYILSKDGVKIPVDDSAAPIHNKEGQIEGAVLVFRDVTLKRNAENQFKQYHEELEKRVDSRTRELNQRVQLEGLTNDIASRLLGSDWDKFNDELNKGIASICQFLNLNSGGVFQVSPDVDDTYIKLAYHSAIDLEIPDESPGPESLSWFSKVMAEKGRVVINHKSEIPDEATFERALIDQWKIQSLVILPLCFDQELILYFSATNEHQWSANELVGLKSVATVIQNALERQRIEVERSLLQEQLHQSQKLEAVGKLTGGIAHDFNNMLVPIIGYAETILEDHPNLDCSTEIEEIRKAASNAAMLTRQLLAFSKKQILDKRPLSLNQEVSEMETMIRRIIGEDIELQIDFSAKNPFIEADLSQLQQIILNLCVNSRDAMPDGGRISISTRNNPATNQIILSVGDDGLGMPDEIKERVFDPFFSTKGINGTGLGLSVVMGIVEQHNGTMELDSKIGVGTTFTITFPTTYEKADEPVEKTSNPKHRVQNKGTRVLLVEDETAVMAFVTMALTKKGFEVFPAENYQEAIDLYQKQRGQFDLIFTDAKLPDGTGIDVLNFIKNDNPNIPSLISSGYTDDRALVNCARKNGVEFLQKPYPLSKMFEVLDVVLSKPNGKEESVELAR